MKLIFCPKCNDIIKMIIGEDRYCLCGSSYGKYTDEINAEIGGKSIPIGFANNSFVYAIKNRPQNGYGLRFDAFVIPEDVPSIKNK